MYPKDNDQICKICLDMVTQARDQLRSNETLADLQAVFEGSCNLIPIKLVRNECDKLVDNFIPELVEALSSEMDPTAVCSVAGLCNNKRIDQLLLEHKTATMGQHDPEYQSMYGDFNCQQCGQIGQIMEDKFQKAHPDDVLDAMLSGCRHTGSFSDSCASLALIHFKEIYALLQKRLTKENICHLSGACYLGYHKHDEMDSGEEEEDGLEIRTMGNVGLIRPEGEKDVPCDLCKQLVVHLRDIVVANSTENEFKDVLKGICGELGQLKDECMNVVEQYSKVIFEALNMSLNPDIICSMIQICPNNLSSVPMMPLLALQPAQIAISLQKKQLPVFTKEEVDAFQLPFDTLMGPQNADQLVENGQVCTLCELVMHFLQQTMAQPATEQEIKESLEKTCDRLPQSVRQECKNFVDTYGDAVLAMLIQEFDPSEVCPLLKMCSQRVKEDVEIFGRAPPTMQVEIQSKDKPTCPLCLFAVTEAQTRIQSNKSMDNIKHTLETLCNHLPQKLNVECTDFVDSYAQILVKLLTEEMSPQQICVQLKLCTEAIDAAVPNFKGTEVVEEENDICKWNGDLMSVNDWVIKLPFFSRFTVDNEIPDNTVNGRVIVMGHMKPSATSTPECLVCQHLVKELEKKLDDKHSREQIKKILDHVCDKVKENLKPKCIAFMDKHEEEIIELVMKGVQPKELCVALGFCMISKERETLEDFMDQWFNPTAVDDLEIDEAFSVDFISLPAGPSSVGRIALTNKAQEKPQRIENGQPPKVRANEGCVLCEFVMTQLEKDLNDHATQEEIKKAVENVCTVMPKTVRGQCTKFVDSYSELIITLLATTPPAKICEGLKMCTPPKKAEAEVVQAVSNDVVECAVCQGAVTIIDRLLEDPTFDRNLEQVVEKTCTVAPKLYKKKCAELVSSYGPSIINMLLAKAQPEKVCEEIQLCFPNEYSTFVQINEGGLEEEEEEDLKMLKNNFRFAVTEVIPSRIRRQVALGSNKCTWGPGYWCKNLANAQECNVCVE